MMELGKYFCGLKQTKGRARNLYCKLNLLMFIDLHVGVCTLCKVKWKKLIALEALFGLVRSLVVDLKPLLALTESLQIYGD